jgi:hypothetical protein
VQAGGHAPRRPHQPRPQRARADTHQETLGGRPGLGDGVLAPVAAHLRVDALGRAAQRQLAQGDQVAFAEEVVRRALGLLRDIDLALFKALEQVVGRQVDQLDLVGLLDDPVRHGFAHQHAGDLGHHIVQALDMLDVDGGVDVDASIQQLLDVLPALGVARTRRIGVRQLVHQDQRRPAGQGGVEVELLQGGAAILDLPPRQERHHAAQGGHAEQGLGFYPAVGLDKADQKVDALGTLLESRLKHGVGFANASGCTKEDFELAALAARLVGLHTGQQLVGIRTLFHTYALSAPRRACPALAGL